MNDHSHSGAAPGVVHRTRVAAWLLLLFVAGVAPHILGLALAEITGDLMHSNSEFAVVAEGMLRQRVGSLYRLLSFPVTIAATLAYMWPVLRWQLGRRYQPPYLSVRRRLVAAPLGLACISFAPWLGGVMVSVGATVVMLGRWSPDLLSQQVFAPLASGFLSSVTTYLVVEWLTRSRVAPLVFPTGRLGEVADTFALGVRSRLLLAMFAVGFLPMFTMTGLTQAANARAAGGAPLGETLQVLADSVGTTFLCFLVGGILYTLMLARTLTRPLGEMAQALGRIERGDLEVEVQIESNDEIGVLGSGINTLGETLREREHILGTFGRVVEPDVRDRLLAGRIEVGGELRCVAVLFCDLRGFTSMAENQSPAQVVATLNSFFGVMSAWVHECGGFVDKFIGDAMLVVFGLFSDNSDAEAKHSAAAALRCAAGMKAQLKTLNQEGDSTSQRPLAMTIGVHAGEVLAGIIGAEDRHEYTVVGDAVNVAARLQQQCRQEGVDMLVSATARDLALSGGAEVELSEHGAVELRGRSGKVCIFAG